MAKLYFYYSAMNAGKSTTLLQSSYNYRERGMETLLFTPSLDTRRAKGRIHSRIGLDASAIPIESTFNILNYVSEKLEKGFENLGCVLVDEAQFLTKAQVAELTDIADDLGIPVLAYGIRSDFRGELFEGSQYLMAWADSIQEIKTICHCGKKATMVVRMDESGQAVRSGAQVEIGGNERYVSTCRKHFKLGVTSSNPSLIEEETCSL